MFCIHRKVFLAVKKVRIVKITPPQVPSTQWKPLPAKFLVLTPLHPLPLFAKPCPITQKSKIGQSDGITNFKNEKDNDLVFK